MIENVFFDIDGVLTDGAVYVGRDGAETKRIDFDDIDAIFELKRVGKRIGFISGEDNEFTEYVKRRFTPDFFVSGCKDKLGYFKGLEEKEGIVRRSSCFVGDSRKDKELLEYLYYSFVPADADAEIKASARFVTEAQKGKGVIKEVARFMLDMADGEEKEERDIENIRKRIREHSRAIDLLEKDNRCLLEIAKVAKSIAQAVDSGRTVFLCGNGGSASDAEHIAGEFVGRFLLDRRPLPAEALTVNTSILTATGNDYSFDQIFSRHLQAKGKKGDVLIALSTSGNSKNVIEAVKVAKVIGIKTVGLTGGNKESMICRLSDSCICVPFDSTPRIQEVHILIGHIICEFVEKALFAEGG